MSKAKVMARISFKHGKQTRMRVLEGEGMTVVTIKEDGSAEYLGVGKVNEVLTLSGVLGMCQERTRHMSEEVTRNQFINAVEDRLLEGLRWVNDCTATTDAMPASLPNDGIDEDAATQSTADQNNPLS